MTFFGVVFLISIHIFPGGLPRGLLRHAGALRFAWRSGEETGEETAGTEGVCHKASGDSSHDSLEGAKPQQDTTEFLTTQLILTSSQNPKHSKSNLNDPQEPLKKP